VSSLQPTRTRLHDQWFRDEQRKDRVFHNTDPHERGWYPSPSIPVSPALALVGFVGLGLLVGAASAGITAHSVRTWYLSLARPPLTPPGWAFAPVWTAMFVLTGVAGWLVWRRQGASRAVRLWGWQLLAAASWSPAFFGLHWPGLGLAASTAVLLLALFTVHAFAAVSRSAAWLMAPYLVWITFAVYLNAGFCWLNPV